MSPFTEFLSQVLYLLETSTRRRVLLRAERAVRVRSRSRAFFLPGILACRAWYGANFPQGSIGQAGRQGCLRSQESEEQAEENEADHRADDTH